MQQESVVSMLASNLLGQQSTWFWSMVQSIAIIVSLVFIYRQVSAQRYANMLSIFMNLRMRWNSTVMLEYRRQTCVNHQSNMKSIGAAEGEVLSFFEELGYMVSRRAVEVDFVWESYSYFIEHYWSMLWPNIRAYRLTTSDHSWYVQFQTLRETMTKYGKVKGATSSSDKGEQEIALFIKGELESAN